MGTAASVGFSPARFLGLCAVDFSARLSYNMARTPVLPLFAAALGAGVGGVGAVVAASTITGIVLKAPAGAFSDFFGRRRTLLLGAVIFAFTPFLYVFAGVLLWLFLIRLVHGIATAIYGPVSNALAAELSAERRGEVLSWFSLIKIGTNAAGGLAGAAVLQAVGGLEPGIPAFHWTYGAAGAAGVLALLLAVILLPSVAGAEPERKRSAREAYRKLWKGLRETCAHAGVLSVSAAESLQNMTMGALQAFLPIYAVGSAGMSILEAGALWSLVTGASLVAKPIMGRISDRTGRWWVIFVGMLLCAVPFALIPFFTSWWALGPLAVLFGLGEAFVTSSSTAMASEACDQTSLGAAMGVFGTIADTGQALGPLAAGALAACLNLQVSFGILAGLLALWAFVFAVIHGRSRSCS
jgi:MFS transporter, DHA1 family, multidrug resistance protein